MDTQAKIAKLAEGGPSAQAGSSAQAWEVENMRERLYCQVYIFPPSLLSQYLSVLLQEARSTGSMQTGTM